MDVTKLDGTTEKFSPSKLCLSIRKAGAPRELADSICKSVEQRVNPHDSTTKIFRKALKYLVREDLDVAARYSLRRGLEALGPAGFVFEQYMEAILQSYGFTTRRNVVLQGKCITHETDVLATVGSKRFVVEAKYHNEPGLKTHVNVIMHADARLQDIVGSEPESARKQYEYAMWVVTNTKFTDAAIQYARCRGIRLTGWNYPRGASLEDVIAQKRLYPVTVLPSIPKNLLPTLAQKQIILAQDLLTYEPKDMMRVLGIDRKLAETIHEEAVGMVKMS